MDSLRACAAMFCFGAEKLANRHRDVAHDHISCASLLSVLDSSFKRYTADSTFSGTDHYSHSLSCATTLRAGGGGRNHKGSRTDDPGQGAPSRRVAARAGGLAVA